MTDTVIPKFRNLARPSLGRAWRRGLLLTALVTLSACAQLNPSAPPRLDEAGASREGFYPVTVKNIDRVRLRALETLNAERTAKGLVPVTADPTLIAAADAHARSMSRQGRAWNFGEDGSSPLEQVRRAGFQGQLLGQVISETYETEVQAIANWMGDAAERATLMDPAARRVGFGVAQDPSNKIWWVLNVGN